MYTGNHNDLSIASALRLPEGFTKYTIVKHQASFQHNISFLTQMAGLCVVPAATESSELGHCVPGY